LAEVIGVNVVPAAAGSGVGVVNACYPISLNCVAECAVFSSIQIASADADSIDIFSCAGNRVGVVSTACFAKIVSVDEITIAARSSEGGTSAVEPTSAYC